MAIVSFCNSNSDVACACNYLWPPSCLDAAIGDSMRVMRIAVASDHAGYELKRELLPYIEGLGHNVADLGAHTFVPGDDYSDYAEQVGMALINEDADRGILICGSGVGVSVAANKMTGIRAAVCHDTYSAHQGVEHDNMNVLVMGSRVVAIELAKELVRSFLSAQFSGEERHVRRLNKVRAIEARFCPGPRAAASRVVPDSSKVQGDKP
jgi:ribose 5-phosphate isomerase B